MYKRGIEFFILDSYISILKIEEYSKDKSDSQNLLYDCKSWDAVMREFSVLGEAIKVLIKQKLFSEDKRKIVDFRNLVIHHYFGIDADIVWDIIKNNLPKLKAELEIQINSLENKNKMLNYFINDNYYANFIVENLKKLKDLKNENN
jgi:uncharacterized protein with HEPN domain